MRLSSIAAAKTALMTVCLFANVHGSAAQSVPAPWVARDIGSPALAGAATFVDGSFRVEAAGSDIGNRSDEFHFVYQALAGDIDVRARVDSLVRVHALSKAGIMIRSSLSADAAHGLVLVSPAKGIEFVRRRADGGNSSQSTGAGSPRWLRLVRAGARVTAFSSGDGTDWTEIGSDIVALGATAYVGLAVTSRNAGERTSAEFSSVAVASSALPEGQAIADIGAPASAGSTAFNDGQYTVTAGGAGIWDSADQFHYIYQPFTGDLDVAARVVSLTTADSWSKAGVMIRETLSAGSRHAMALVSASNGYAFQRRTETNAWSDHSSGAMGTAPGWVRLVRRGVQVEAFRSTDGLSWVSMGQATVAMNETVYVGLAVSSHSVTATTRAVVDSWQITAPVALPNQPPAVIVNSPVDGTTLVAPAAVTVSASATDADGTIARVDFYANGTLVGQDADAPYSVAVTLPAGSYAIKAVATDDDGAAAISASVGISVAAATTGAPRAIAFTVSADHDTLVTNYVLEVYTSGSTPGSSSAVATSDLGKPAPSSSGDVTVDRSAFFEALAPGNYIATVRAVGDAGSARSEAVSFTR